MRNKPTAANKTKKARRQNKSIHSKQWERAADRLMAEAMQKSGHEISAVERIFGRMPTIAVVGPTGSGKSALINAILGVSLLPEGSNHTTPVPTVVQKGSDNNWHLRAISAKGHKVRGIPKLNLSVSDLKCGSNNSLAHDDIVERLDRSDDIDAIIERHETFWGPSFDAAEKGKCIAIEVRAPLDWLPEGVRMVDIPGYEGWYPDEQPALHSLVLDWLNVADHTAFVFSNTKVVVGGGGRFLAHYAKLERTASVLVSHMDRFDATGSDLATALINFEVKVSEAFKAQGLQQTSGFPVYFGAARIGRRRGADAEQLAYIVTNTHAFLNDIFDAAMGVTDRLESRHQDQVDATLTKAYSLTKTVFEDAMQVAQAKFHQPADLSDLHSAIGLAIDKTPLSAGDIAWAVVNRDDLAKRYEKRIVKAIETIIQRRTKKAMSAYKAHITKHLEHQLVGLFNQSGSSHGHGLGEQIRGAVDGVSNVVGTAIGTLVGGIVLAIVGKTFLVKAGFLGLAVLSSVNPLSLSALILGAILGLGSGGFLARISPRQRLVTEIKSEVKSAVDQKILDSVWEAIRVRCVGTKTEISHLEQAWRGLDGNGQPLRGPTGESIPGLEDEIGRRFDQALRKKTRQKYKK